jgi:Xaa-Pro aminopeptidase
MAIKQHEYITRRRNLAHKMAPHSVAIIPGAQEILRNGDSHYRFRQDSSFYYLTGFEEPDTLLIITSGKDSQSYLFNRAKNPSQEQWTGKRLGQVDAPQTLAIDEAFDIAQFEKKLPELLTGKEIIYFPVGKFPHWQEKVFASWNKVKEKMRGGIQAPNSFTDIAPLIGEMRLFKSAEEISYMQKAADISVKAHQAAMKAAKFKEFEYQLEAELIYQFAQGGCRGTAYDSIVASGANACVLHYTENNQPLKEDALILIDAGGEYNNYAADITRTFPKNGVFSAEQRELYNLVLKAQQGGINLIRPGILWNEIQQTILNVLTAGLVELGILKGDVKELVQTQAYLPFYMHNSGHWLGLDVHDAGLYKIDNQWRPLEEGMVLTVEPGLYISPQQKNIEARWLGVGIRIEDDILITKDGKQNLTGELAVEIADIEALMRD